MFVKWNTISIRSTTSTAVPQRRRRKRWGSPRAWSQRASAPSSWRTSTSGGSPTRCWSARVHSVHTAQQSPGENSSLLGHLDVTLLDVTLRNWTHRIRFLATSCFLCALSVLINTSVPSYTVQWLTVRTTWITCLQKSLWLLCSNSNCAAVIHMCSFKVLCVLKQKDVCYLKKGKKEKWIFSFYVGAWALSCQLYMTVFEISHTDMRDAFILQSS